MIHPSYNELMEKVNAGNDTDKDIVTSRYSIVLATSKRARQLTNGSAARVKVKNGKLLSVAVEELYEGKINIVEEEDAIVDDVVETSEDVVTEENA